MRQKLLREGADELTYEIRGIVRKAEQLEQLGLQIYLENMMNPFRSIDIPGWIKDIVINLLKDNTTYGYSHSRTSRNAYLSCS